VAVEAGYYIPTGSYVLHLCKVNLLETTFDQEGSMNRRKFKVLASLNFPR
jgi:hypothetical protein